VFLTYTSTFLTNLSLVVLLYMVLSLKGDRSQGWLRTAKDAGFIFGPILVLLAICFPYRVETFIQMTRFLSKVAAGWSLQYISPISMLGLNTGMGIIFAAGNILVWMSLVLFAVYLILLVKKSASKRGWKDPRLQILTLFAALWILYNLAFGFFGADSYNQWKFATFYPMIFCFIFSLMFFEKFSTTKKSRWILAVLFLSIGIMTVQEQSSAMTKKIPRYFKQLTEVNLVQNIDNIIVTPLSPEENMILTQFIVGQKLWFMGYSQPPAVQDLKDETIASPRSAFLGKASEAFDPSDVLIKVGESFVLLKNSEKYVRAAR
jgi:hypothetical protein